MTVSVPTAAAVTVTAVANTMVIMPMASGFSRMTVVIPVAATAAHHVTSS